MKTRKGFTIIELLIVLSIVAILAGLILPAIAHARDKSQVKEAIQVNEVLYYKGVETRVTDYKGLVITIQMPNATLEDIRWRDLPDDERERLTRENRPYEQPQSPHVANVQPEPTRSTPVSSSSFPFLEGDIIRHKLNGWRGVVVTNDGNSGTIRFQINDQFQTVEGVREHEIRAGY